MMCFQVHFCRHVDPEAECEWAHSMLLTLFSHQSDSHLEGALVESQSTALLELMAADNFSLAR